MLLVTDPSSEEQRSQTSFANAALRVVRRTHTTPASTVNEGPKWSLAFVLGYWQMAS
jgi:hypothetical protein